MNIKEKLEHILEKSKIVFDYDETCFNTIFNKLIINSVTSCVETKNTLFIGQEKDIFFLKKILPDLNIVYRIPGEETEKEMDSTERLLVVYEKDIPLFLKESKDVCILGECLKKNGITMAYGSKGICKIQEITDYHPHVYEEIRILNKEYSSTDNKCIKKKLLQNLIVISLKITDFKHAFLYIKEYIKSGYDKQNKYKEFEIKLSVFLQEIENCLKRRNHQDILLFWVDALEQTELKHMPFLKQYAQNSLFFDRSYSFTPFTSASVKIMFDKVRQIEEKGFENANFKVSQSKLYLSIQEHGYDFNYFGLKGIADKIDVITHNGREDFDPSMLHLWDAIDYILNHDGPSLVMIHHFLETHMPWYSPEGEDPLIWASAYSTCGDHEKELRQRRAGQHYLDGQLEFFSRFFEYPCTKVFFSDHGSERDIRYNEKNLNTLLFIKSSYIDKGLCKRLFSVYQFQELIEFLFSPSEEKLENMFLEHNVALFQDADVYNAQGVEYCLNHSSREYGLAFRGVVGEKDKYVCLGDGTEFYYLLPNEEINLIGEEMYADRIRKLKEIAGDTFLDIYAEDKFEHSRRLYK